MHITILHAKNIEMTEAIQAYIEEKFASLGKYMQALEPVDKCDIEIGKNSEHHQKGKVFYAEVTMQIPGDLIRIEVLEEDLYAAIDKAKDELKEKLIQIKERRIDARKG